MECVSILGTKILHNSVANFFVEIYLWHYRNSNVDSHRPFGASFLGVMMSNFPETRGFRDF